MKKTLLTVILLIIIKSFCGQEHYRYAAKSGYIKYKYTGSVIGDQELYWDNYGEKLCRISRLTIKYKFGESIISYEDHGILIRNGSETIHVDLIDSTGWINNPGKTDINTCYKIMLSEQKQQEIATLIIDSLEQPVVGYGKVRGKKCTIVQDHSSKSWIYKGLVLKSKRMSTEDLIEYSKAKEFQENIDIPTEIFMPLDGIQLEDNTESQKALIEAFMAAAEKIEEDEKKEKSFEEYIIDTVSITPVSYSFVFFEDAIEKLKPSGLILGQTIQGEGNYIALFNGEYNSSIRITVTSSFKLSSLLKKYNNIEFLNYKGKSMIHGYISEKGILKYILIIEYKDLCFHLIINSTEDFGHSELLDLSKKIKFK